MGARYSPKSLRRASAHSPVVTPAFAALIEAGAIDGLSIGYRTVRSEKAAKGGRLLHEIELWEVSLVTFPMLPEARVQADVPDAEADLARTLAETFREARALLA